ncbi:MAG: hypothetical protein A4E48_01932 [Methanosaeta sp. PtaU1.Bin060]|nr:MAG: hypothetical protein A4E48_01932 [Methanosaeta sp. PtaU1.Bin060]
MGTGSAETLITWPPMGGMGCPNLNFSANPAFNDALEFPAALFQGFACGPYALQLGDLPVKGFGIIDDLVSRLLHCGLDVAQRTLLN